MPGYRKERLEKEIRVVIAETLLKEVKDPRIGFVTFTGVELNKDKSVAVVSVSVLGDAKSKKKSMIGLNSAKGYFQFRLGKEIKIRSVPMIVFKLDTSIEEGAAMLDTLDRIGKERKDSDAEESEDEE